MFRISLFENAVDELKAAHMYIESFLDWKDDADIPDIEKLFAIKHIIKHLSACWELLMKYYIQKREPKAIFINPNQITEEKLKAGSFKTIGYKKAVELLNGYHIDNSFSKLIELHKYRNQIEHYQIEVSFVELIQTIVNAINDLIKFCSIYITPITEDKGTMNDTGNVVIGLFSTKKELEELLLSGFFSNHLGTEKVTTSLSNM